MSRRITWGRPWLTSWPVAAWTRRLNISALDSRSRLVRERHLEEDPARLDVGDPPLRRALARTHPGLGRLLRDGAVREDRDPDLATTTDMPVHRDTRRLDLPVRHVRRLQRLDAVLAERHPGAAFRHPVARRVVRLTEALGRPTRHEHDSALLRLHRLGRGRGGAVVGKRRLGGWLGRRLGSGHPGSRGTAGLGPAGCRTGGSGAPAAW